MGDHVLTMINMMTQLDPLDFHMDVDFQIDLILQLLPESFFGFILNFSMNKIQSTFPKLLNMLRIAHAQFKGKGNKGVLAIASTSRSFKRRSTFKKKRKLVRPRKQVSKTKSKEKVSKEKYFLSWQDGHWKGNCPKIQHGLRGKYSFLACD